jgi:acetyl-CoA carboxylase biotin carboxyl carrier protein
MGMIREETIRRLIRIVEESQIDELEVSRWGTRVKITRQRARENSHGEQAAPAPLPATVGGNHAPVAAPSSPPAAPDADLGLVPIKSPMVGTFYSAPAPGQPSFVNASDRIAVGQVVCIIEAMKLMNEIHSDVEGRVTKVLVGSGQPVEYGQTLFLIDPKG